MYVIAVASQKGGSGKTTLAGHIAVEADRRGVGPVALVDTDPQGSLAEWWNARTAETPLFARTGAERLADDIARMQALGIKMLVIDTPPAIEATISEVVQVSNIIVVPARPSPHDLRAAGATVELVERHKKPLVFVINGAAPRARITSEAVMALSQHGTLAPAIIHQRTAFAASMIDGRTVMEIPGEPRAAGEIAMLWEYLYRRLLGEHRTLLASDAALVAPNGADPESLPPVSVSAQ
ncbi:MAG TPA: ParA family protein [Stellaceae bacterium]|nr:ParA family protein [Stellaceae bacterium]